MLLVCSRRSVHEILAYVRKYVHEILAYVSKCVADILSFVINCLSHNRPRKEPHPPQGTVWGAAVQARLSLPKWWLVKGAEFAGVDDHVSFVELFFENADGFDTDIKMLASALFIKIMSHAAQL